MTNRYLIDTSAWIFALRRRAIPVVRARVQELLEQDAVDTSGAVELELLTGALTTQEYAMVQRQLVGVRRLDTEEGDWAAAGLMGFTLRRRGITIAAMDLLVAAVAIRNNAILLHADRDFDLLAQHTPLKVESMVAAVTNIS